MNKSKWSPLEIINPLTGIGIICSGATAKELLAMHSALKNGVFTNIDKRIMTLSNEDLQKISSPPVDELYNEKHRLHEAKHEVERYNTMFANVTQHNNDVIYLMKALSSKIDWNGMDILNDHISVIKRNIRFQIGKVYADILLTIGDLLVDAKFGILGFGDHTATDYLIDSKLSEANVKKELKGCEFHKYAAMKAVLSLFSETNDDSIKEIVDSSYESFPWEKLKKSNTNQFTALLNIFVHINSKSNILFAMRHENIEDSSDDNSLHIVIDNKNLQDLEEQKEKLFRDETYFSILTNHQKRDIDKRWENYITEVKSHNDQVLQIFESLLKKYDKSGLSYNILSEKPTSLVSSIQYNLNGYFLMYCQRLFIQPRFKVQKARASVYYHKANDIFGSFFSSWKYLSNHFTMEVVDKKKEIKTNPITEEMVKYLNYNRLASIETFYSLVNGGNNDTISEIWKKYNVFCNGIDWKSRGYPHRLSTFLSALDEISIQDKMFLCRRSYLTPI